MTSSVERGYAKGRAKRAEIIERATTLFGVAGYRGASLRDIAARCGLSHPGLLHHFASKEALLIAVLEHRDQQDGARFELRDDGHGGTGGGVDALRRYVELVVWNSQRRGIVELYAVLSAEATAADHPAHDFFAQRYGRVRHGMTTAFEEARLAGALQDGVDPALAARELVALMDGLQVQWLLDPDLDMVGALREHLQQRLTVPL